MGKEVIATCEVQFDIDTSVTSISEVRKILNKRETRTLESYSIISMEMKEYLRIEFKVRIFDWVDDESMESHYGGNCVTRMQEYLTKESIWYSLVSWDILSVEENGNDYKLVYELLQDYALWVGFVVMGEERFRRSEAEPMTYMEEYLEQYTIERRYATSFLSTFYEDTDVIDFLDGFIWEN